MAKETDNIEVIESTTGKDRSEKMTKTYAQESGGYILDSTKRSKMNYKNPNGDVVAGSD